MRVLLIPELYRPTNVSANGSLNDAITWVERWLDIDPRIHVYWLLPPRRRSGYEAADVLADRERVTLVEANGRMSGDESEFIFTESGYTDEQLHALKASIFDDYGYVDVAVDQLRTGRMDLYKWLLFCSGHRAGTARLPSVVANVHDLQLPFKYEGTGYRARYHERAEIASAAFADRIWFKAGVDADGFVHYGREILTESTLERARSRSLLTNSPMDFSPYSERYRDEPQWLHIAGSTWGKKHFEVVLAVAEELHARYGIRTIVTSMTEIPEVATDEPWVEAYPEADRETFHAALERGDLAVCASEYETLARTWFEQAASGQVLVLRDEPWIYDCVPEDHPFIGSLDELPALARRAVEEWDDAVVANRRLVDHVKTVRDPKRAGQRTHDDLLRLVRATRERYDPEPGNAVERVVADRRPDRIALDDLDERTAAHTPEGVPFLDSESGSLNDLVLSLRALGYEDRGNAGVPVFERADADSNGVAHR